MVKEIKSIKGDAAIVNESEDIEVAQEEGDYTPADHRPSDPRMRIGPNETAEEVEERLEQQGLLDKYRVYVDSAEDVPDQYDVQEGAQGGLYYEVGGDDDDDDGGGPANADPREVAESLDEEHFDIDDIAERLENLDDPDDVRVFDELHDRFDGGQAVTFLQGMEDPITEREEAIYDATLFADETPDEILDAALGPDVGDYSVDTQFGYDVAEAVNDGNVVSEVPAQQWRDNTGQIDDDDLLLDALEQIEDDGTKTAKDRIRQRLRSSDLGYTDEEIDEFLSDGDDGGVTSDAHDQWDEEFELPPESDMDNRESLYDHDDADTGVTAKSMEVVTLDDGYTEAFVTHYNEIGAGQNPPSIDMRAETEARDRQMIAYEGTRMIEDRLGIGADETVPPHTEGEDGGWVAAKSFPGEPAWELPTEGRKVNADETMNGAAVQMILGNNDLHTQNVFADYGGNVSFIDLDHSAGDMMEDDPAGFANKNGERGFNRIADSLMRVANNPEDLVGPDGEISEDGVKEALYERTEELAGQLNTDEFKDQLREKLSDREDHLVENVINNIENFADPDVEVPH